MNEECMELNEQVLRMLPGEARFSNKTRQLGSMTELSNRVFTLSDTIGNATSPIESQSEMHCHAAT